MTIKLCCCELVLELICAISIFMPLTNYKLLFTLDLLARYSNFTVVNLQYLVDSNSYKPLAECSTVFICSALLYANL